MILDIKQNSILIGDVTLRPFLQSDALLLFNGILKSKTELIPRLAWCREDYSLHDTCEFIIRAGRDWNNDYSFHFGAFKNKNKDFLGSVSLHHVDLHHHIASLGYWICTGEHRKGLASATAKEVVKFGFNELKLERIEIITACDNISSQKVAFKLGAVEEGNLRNRFCNNNIQIDAKIFSIVPEDIVGSKID